jgi:hypothetical protein
MKLDRNIPLGKQTGIGKYALIKMREYGGKPPDAATHWVSKEPVFVVPKRLVDFGCGESEFFVIRLKDKYAYPALLAYADAAERDDPEYANEIREMAARARTHPNSQRPT